MNEPNTPEISWKAIEKGTPVYSSEGEAAGKVAKVVGDADADIFSGLALSMRPFGGERLVASERVRAIRPDRVDLALTKTEIEALPRYEEVPSIRWRPGSRSLLRRLFGR